MCANNGEIEREVNVCIVQWQRMEQRMEKATVRKGEARAGRDQPGGVQIVTAGESLSVQGEKGSLAISSY
jgi:hypothetical protein